jgi:signal peptidase I
MRRRRLRRIGATVFTVVGLVVIVALSSGEVGLVTTHGVSMLPRFHTGDLAVIVPSGSYHVGDVVGYESPLLHITVLHRIVAEHTGLFTFKGDHNGFLDPMKLPASAIRGRLWARVPHGGTVLSWVRSPPALGLLAFALVAMGIAGGANRRHRARAVGVPGSSGSAPKHAAVDDTAPGWWPVAVPLGVAVVFTLVALMAWSRPATRPAPRPVSYGQHVTFSYSATAPAGATYPTGTLSTGDPVFLRLVQSLDVRARYAFAVTGPSAPSGNRSRTALSGTIAATAALEGPGGWSGRLAAAGPVAFSGTTAGVDLRIDLARIATLEKAFSDETGMSLGTTDIVITPTVDVHGTVGGATVVDSFALPLAFQMSGAEINLVSADPGGRTATFPQLTPDRSGSVTRPALVTATVSILGRSMAVDGVRRVGLAGVVLSLAGACGAWLWVRRRRRMDETQRIHAAHGHELVAVTSSPAEHARLMVEVETFPALARLARRYDCVILELGHPAGSAYYVECGATIYRCGPEPEPFRALAAVDDTVRPTDLTYYVTALPSAS